MNLRSLNAARRRPARRFANLISIAIATMPLFASAAPTGDAALDASLAERLALIADDTAQSEQAPEALLRQSAALLDLARESSPKEVRFARSSAGVLLRLGEADRAYAALGAVRALDPKDQLAQIQFVDLAANKMESADAREAYLQQIIDANSLTPEVRSHAAISLMDLLYQRSEDARAAELLDKAIALNPQNIAALAEKYRQAVQSGSGLDRAKALSALVQASPLDPRRLARVASECISAADYADAHSFHEFAFNVMLSRGQSPSADDMIELAGSELLGDDSNDIAPLVKQALTALKNDGRLYTIDLLISQFAGAKSEDLSGAIATARGVYLAQVAAANQLLNHPETREMPTTSPAVPLPDVAADAAKLTASDASGLKSGYTIALAELLWFDVYFRAAPVDDSSIAALATLLGDEADPIVVRIQGWKLLSAGQAEEAKVKLAAVADRDGFAKLGLAAAQAATGQAEDSKKTLDELLAARPDGMLAVFAATAAKKSDVKVVQTADEKEIAAVYSALRRPVGDAFQNPRGSYLLTAQPVNVSFGIGEPLLARATLQNNGRFPLTIGPGGFVEPRFLIDVSIRGDAAKNFPAVGTGTWAGAVRLLPGQAITQIIRLDRGQAYGFFRQYPTPLMMVTAAIVSNGIPTQKVSFPAAGGQLASVGNVMERRSSPMFVESFRKNVIDKIANGTPLERLNYLEFASAVIPLLDQQAENKDARAVSDELKLAFGSQIAKEPVPEVKAWAIVSRLISGGGKAEELATVMTLDSPVAKAAGLIMARSMPIEQRRKFAQAVIDSGEKGPVRELAVGLREQPDPPAPATQPAGASTNP